MSEEQKPEVTEADVMWEALSKAATNLFTIPNRTVGDYIERVSGPPDALVVKLKAPAALVAIEQAVLYDPMGNLVKPPEYTIDTSEEGYVTIRKASGKEEEKQKVIKMVSVDGAIVAKTDDDE